MNNTQTLLALIILVVLVLLYTRTCSNNLPNLNNKLDHNVDTYLFWTSGFDSTFRLCQLLIDENKVVQPIYIMDENTDGIKMGIRKSWRKEIQTMNEIISELHYRYPHTKKLLRPTLYIKNVQLDRETINVMTNLHHLGFTSRPVNQWAYMAQIMRDLRIVAEVGLVDEDHPHLRKALENSIREVNWESAIKPDCGSMWDNHKFVDKKHLEAYWFNKLEYAQEVINDGHQPSAWKPQSLSRTTTTFLIDPKDEQLKIFHNMRFPLYNLRKNDLFNYANKNGYSDILRMTWSCWNPNLLGQPCGKCEMCRDRIV